MPRRFGLVGRGVLLAAAATALVASVVELRWFGGPRSVPASESRRPRRLIPIERPVPVASHERGTAPEVLATVDQFRPPWSLGLALIETRQFDEWSDHRALVRHDGRVRAYAIGDLLPHGAILVAIGAGAVLLMVGDVELVRLGLDGSVASVHDFRTIDDRRRLRVVSNNKEYREALLDVLAFLRSEDPKEVQGAIDALIDAGPAAVGVIVPYADSQIPVATATYAFASVEPRRPYVYGDVIVGILEAITGHSFGDPMAGQQTEEERQSIRRQWPRWWGLRR